MHRQCHTCEKTRKQHASRVRSPSAAEMGTVGAMEQTGTRSGGVGLPLSRLLSGSYSAVSCLMLIGE